MKPSGFDIENTHLQDIGHTQKLVFLVMVAFVWGYKVETCFNQIRHVKIKKHGRMTKNIFKYGLDHIASMLLNLVNKNNMNLTQFLLRA